MSIFSSSADWEWIFLTEVWQHSHSRGKGAACIHWDLEERLSVPTITLWSVPVIQDDSMPERLGGIPQGTGKAEKLKHDFFSILKHFPPQISKSPKI